MPDPTPTPDTLSAAVERLCADLDDEAGNYLAAEPIHFRELAEATRMHAAQFRAVLAASPAPTDSPDERHDTSCEQAVGFVSCNCCQRRPAAVTAPREDETAFQVVVVHDDLARALDAWLAARGLGRSRMPSAPDDLPTFCVAPALAAAPAVERADDEALYEYLEARLRAPAQEYPTTMHLARALLADPRLPWAVERATPDPDTLAALVPHYDWCVNPGDDDEWCSCWPVRLTVARALIAAGVTCPPGSSTTETTDPTQ